MEELLGTSLSVFIGLTVILFGGAGFLTGQAVANGWKPAWLAACYALLLTCGDRFMVYALFDGALLSVSGFLVHAAVLVAITLTAWRLTRARKMVSQYPWLYERDGVFGWREKAHAR
jgi:hypothetical protein